MDQQKQNVLITPLNWGLGHATRCIPVIRALEKNGFTPIIASDGVALEMLKKEFPTVLTLELPSYHIEYAKNGAFFKWKLLKNSPKMIMAIRKEKKIVAQWVQKYDIKGIISDNRLGVFSKKMPCVFITHQLNVLTGNTSWITSKMHQYVIKKYAECWVPDVEGYPNLTGKLGHTDNPFLKIKYLGPLSRLEKKTIPEKYGLMVILSGPDPQRGILEERLKSEVLRYAGNVLFIKGIIESEQKIDVINNVTYYNYMNSTELEQAFNESEMVLCRSGYTTVMDLAKLRKKAFLYQLPDNMNKNIWPKN